jgi:hypothetical protein
VPREADPLLDNPHTFGLEQMLLERSVGLANQDSAAAANDAVPGNALPGRTCSHGVPGGASSSAQAQGSCKPSIR